MSSILGRIRVSGSSRLDDTTQSISGSVIEATEGNDGDGQAVSGSISLTVRGGETIDMGSELHVQLTAAESTDDAQSADVDAPDAEQPETD